MKIKVFLVCDELHRFYGLIREGRWKGYLCECYPPPNVFRDGEPVKKKSVPPVIFTKRSDAVKAIRSLQKAIEGSPVGSPKLPLLIIESTVEE